MKDVAKTATPSGVPAGNPANEPLVDFHLAMQRFTVGGHQRRAEFVQKLEGGLVPCDAKLFLELQGRDARRQRGNEIGSMEPKSERESASMQARASCQTHLVPIPALGYAPRGQRVAGARTTLWTDETRRPT